MKGGKVKSILRENGYILSDIAIKIDKSPQNFDGQLKTDDIKSGLLESIVDAIGENMSFFYPEIKSGMLTGNFVHGNGNSVVAGQNNKIEIAKCQDDLEAAMCQINYLKKLIDEKDKLINEKERLISILLDKK